MRKPLGKGTEGDRTRLDSYQIAGLKSRYIKGFLEKEQLRDTCNTPVTGGY